MTPSACGVAVVTGSTTGIGWAIAAALADRGYGVVINSARSAEEGVRLAAALPDAIYVQADVADPEQATTVIDRAASRWGRLDVLVNNAATTSLARLSDLDAVTDEIWRRVLDVNLLGAWHMIVPAVRLMRANGGGNIINTTSYAATRTATSSLPYAVSKAALNHLTALLAVALGPDIRVNAVAPGLIETRWTQDWDRSRAHVAGRAPLRRVGLPTDVAAACLSLLDSSYTTGCVLPVDGGLGLR